MVSGASSPELTIAFDESAGIAHVLYYVDQNTTQLVSRIIQSIIIGTPGINASPNPLNFSNVNVDISVDKTVMIASTGDADLTISSVSSPNLPFSIQSDNCSGFSVSPGDTCTIVVRFSPTSAITSTDSFTINSNAANVVVTLLGNGVEQYTISGYVRTSQGVGISGVLMSGDSCSSTNGSGYYNCTVSNGWSGTIRPSKSGYTFYPSSRSYSNVTYNMSNENYTGYTCRRC